MKTYLKLLLVLLPFITFSQAPKEIDIQSQIKIVTVFLEGAQIERTATQALQAGKSTLVFKGLSPFTDPESIALKLDGKATLLSVSHRMNYLDLQRKDERVKALEAQVEGIDDSLAIEAALEQTLKDEESLLKSNQKVGGTQSGYELEKLQAIAEYYRNRIQSIRLALLDIQKRRKTLNARKTQLTKQRRALQLATDENTSEIVTTIQCEQAQSLRFEFTYLTTYAGWFPNYDIRVKDVTSPVQLTYKAQVYQQTGEDWSKVKLRFSNANPKQTGYLASLDPQYLSFNNYFDYRNSGINNSQAYLSILQQGGTITGIIVDQEMNEPLIGANVMVPGTTIGTVTDFDGRFSITVPPNTPTLSISYVGYSDHTVNITSNNLSIGLNADGATLDEVVVRGTRNISGLMSKLKKKRDQDKAPSLPTRTLINPTNVTFELDLPFSLPSDGKVQTLALAAYDLPADYEYRCTPKIDKDAFLFAKVANWQQYNLLEGEASLFFEGTYVGRSLLDVKRLQDTLTLSLGRDRGVAVVREKVKDFSKKQFVGSKRIESRKYSLEIRNNKNQPIRLVLTDQIPKSKVKEITVEEVKVDGGSLDGDTGIVKWTLSLAAREKAERELSYQVKYPKKRFVQIE